MVSKGVFSIRGMGLMIINDHKQNQSLSMFHDDWHIRAVICWAMQMARWTNWASNWLQIWPSGMEYEVSASLDETSNMQHYGTFRLTDTGIELARWVRTPPKVAGSPVILVILVILRPGPSSSQRPDPNILR